MSGVKIKIECDDVLLAAAIASSISEGLRLDDFDNVQVKTVMVYNEVARDAQGRLTDFERTSVVRTALDESALRRAPMYDVVLCPPGAALAHPVSNETLRARSPEKLHTPIVIDMGLEPGPYTAQERTFLAGEKTS
jgi:hypothetical protein